MKKLWMLWMLVLPFCLSAQNHARAEEILDKTFEVLSDNSGIRVEFVGTDSGFLLLKGEKFYLNNSNIQCWYNGDTQWSYVAENKEVNISNPTPEELQDINPYFILKNYKDNFHCTYQGNTGKKGAESHLLVLTSKHAGGNEIVRLTISNRYQPTELKIEQNGQTLSHINIISFRKNQHLEDNMFHFNKTLYPDIEVIDLR